MQNTVSYTGRGTTSGRDITVEVKLTEPGCGIVFQVGDEFIGATAENVVHTMRNVVLGKNTARLCIVEHFLAAASLCGLDNLLVKVSGMEMPLGDGSAKLWIDLFEKTNWAQTKKESVIKLKEPIICKSGDKVLMALPDEKFSLSYHMDWNHPAIGKRWQRWNPDMNIREIADARTFGLQKEHDMLGIGAEAVSLTDTGFSQPLRFEDEPVRHKILDLMGDLALSGVNPMSFKAQFVSIKAGHELDVEMAKKLRAVLQSK